MKRIFLYILLCIAAAAVLYFAISSSVKAYEPVPDDLEMGERVEQALQFAKRKGLSTNYAIFVDYSIPSGSPRLFVWDFKANKVAASTYVMHGSGGGNTGKMPVFSNKVGSNCSSLGRFEVHKDRNGAKLKRSFRMSCFDKTNSNAWGRGIMIHRSKWVDLWSWKKYIPLHTESCQGCITVGSKGMSYLERLIKKEKKTILLWTYYSKL